MEPLMLVAVAVLGRELVPPMVLGKMVVAMVY